MLCYLYNTKNKTKNCFLSGLHFAIVLTLQHVVSTTYRCIKSLSLLPEMYVPLNCTLYKFVSITQTNKCKFQMRARTPRECNT